MPKQATEKGAEKRPVEIEKAVADTSIIVEGILSLKIGKGELKISELLIHEAVLAELEHQANQGRATGYVGLDEIKRLQQLAKGRRLELKITGRRPGLGEIRYAKLGEIDALIRQLAYEEDATLITADHVQAHVGEARGLKVMLFLKEVARKTLKLERFFDENTMSVHLRENTLPMAKKGFPGAWRFVPVAEKALNAEEIKEISREILEEANTRPDSFVEIEREGSTIVQLGLYRIVTLKPPLSDGWEITAVKPVRKLKLGDYEMSEKLRERIETHAEGILIAGAPGMGKSTFAQALAEFYAEKGKIVKTVEAPRDLVLPENITQLAFSRATPEEIHDILLLSRPDYTLFDEMRNPSDFLLFADLRLAGVGMIGVVHGTCPLDAIQRFIGKIELGVIPHIIDTVVFIKNGKIDKVLAVHMEVKVPSGMTEADLARPVVVVSEFETGKPFAEIYTYGEQTVVVPVVEAKQRGAQALAAQSIERYFKKYSDKVKVEIVSNDKAIVYVSPKSAPAIIGKEGKNIQRIEQELGMGIDVRELDEFKKLEPEQEHREIPYEFSSTSKHLEFTLNTAYAGKKVNILADSEHLATLAVGEDGTIRIRKAKKLGKMLANALKQGEKIKFTT